MSERSKKPEHPGIFVRRNVIPRGMTVTEAAKKLVVGRPALSNLLNGNASLSHNMAVRLEKSFGADRKKLLDIQDTYDRFELQGEDKYITARTYVPNFLTIRARQIDNWAEEDVNARQMLAVLLRKLIHSTGNELHQVDFPGYDNAQRRGWDGQIVTGAATPWIPEGKSGWEFGTEGNPKSKADKDYAARVASVTSVDRTDCTFVFVTPRNWQGKTEWARTKEEEGAWKHVRAYDASDLEQWLEESIPGQMWLAEQLGMPLTGFETMDRSWRRWEEASEPRMVPEFFEPSITANRDTFERWLGKPSERPFLVAADSIDEALAFIACLFQEVGALHEDLAVVFDSPQSLRILVESASPFIPIVFTQEMERELATVYRRLHCIVVRPRNAVDSKPHIELERLNHDSFRKGLSAIGIEDDHARRLERASGRSPTILRRRLSKIDAIRTPRWSEKEDIARCMVPIALVGAWHSRSKADREVVSALSGNEYDDIEKQLKRLLRFDDCPVWSVGHYRGAASKIDTLFAVSKDVIDKDLDDFFFLAEYVLSEADPKLELPEDRRWAAGLYGKVRDHSTALRDGICETLVILSVHGNFLFQDRLGIDVEGRVSVLIRRLLTPLTLEKLLSHQRDLPHYAEAAPDEFLTLIEEDLRTTKPIVLDLLKPAGPGLFSSPVRIGLLWALECLAWKHFGRVSSILCELSMTVIDDNWSPKPISSLLGVYRSWLPQTAASIDQRIEGVEYLTKRFPAIGWKLCMDQLSTVARVAMPNYRPRWRSDASNAGRIVDREEDGQFKRKALDLVLEWPKQDLKTLSGLIKRLRRMPAEDQCKVWSLVDKWSRSEADEKGRAALRDTIRVYTLTRRGRGKGSGGVKLDQAQKAFDKLRPRNPALEHAWLFVQHTIEPSTDEIEDDNFDYAKYEEKIRVLRKKALKEIWADRGFEGVIALLSESEAPDRVGISLARSLTSTDTMSAFLRQCLSVSGSLEKKVDSCMQGLLLSAEDEVLEELLSAAVEWAETSEIVRLFRCAPFRRSTWCVLSKCNEGIRKRYWQKVNPLYSHDIEEELNEIVDRLLEAGRPDIAFRIAQWNWTQIETSRLKRLIAAIAGEEREAIEPYGLDVVYGISEALRSLDSRTGVSEIEMARLEFMFLGALEDSEHGIPNLERQMAQSPSVFAQVLALAYKRSDDGQDPAEWRIDDSQKALEMAKAAYLLLRRVARIPGTDKDGNVNPEALIDWLTEVRRMSTELGRSEICDQKIGELLSRAPGDENGAWPCSPVCVAMERIASYDIGIGFKVGAFNRRDGILDPIVDPGAKEDELAAKYRGWAKQRTFDFPYVSNVLNKIAKEYDQQSILEKENAKVRSRLEF